MRAPCNPRVGFGQSRAHNTRPRFLPAFAGSAYRVRAFVSAFAVERSAAEKKQFCGLVPGLHPVKTAGALHPSAAEKNGRKTALPGDGSQLRPWPPSAPRLARCACECVRARWAVAVFAFDIVHIKRSRESPKICLFSRVCACAATSPPLYIYLYIYIYLRGGAYYARA